MISQTATICNNRGLHARASVALAKAASAFDATIIVSHEGVSADAKSVMDLLMLAAHKGCTVDVQSRGSEAEQALEAIVALIEDKFGEDE